MDTILTTERLFLRKWTEADLPSLFQMNQDKEVMKYFLNTLNEEESLAFYNRVQAHFITNGFGLYVVEDKFTNSFMGYTGFMIANFESSFTPCVEIGWRFKKEYWGNGYATEAATACLDYGFDDLNFKSVYSFTSVLNNKSEAVMQRIGMQKIGEFNHPKIKAEHPLCIHVNYLITRP
jgi:RimJ/RimL family protein N-acetyltransferase